MRAVCAAALALVALLSWACGGAVAEFRYVPTPSGYMLSHCIHRVPSGASVVRNEQTGLFDVYGADGTYLAPIPKCNTANGAFPMILPRSAGGSSSSSGGGGGALPHGNRRHLSQFPPDYDGWLAYTAYNLTAGFNAFLGDFSVPNEPSSTPDVLYLFTGLQNVDWVPIVDPEVPVFDIIQPVLQYPGDQGNYWSVKSWYVTTDAGAMATDELQVNVGDFIFGNMTQTGPTTWYIGSTRNNLTDPSQTVALTVTHNRLAVQPWAYNTLECYGCSGCSTYPQSSPCSFTELSLTSAGVPIIPDWKVNPKPSHNMQCKEKPVVVSPSNVVIDFGNE